jgi:hypothetical protein
MPIRRAKDENHGEIIPIAAYPEGAFRNLLLQCEGPELARTRRILRCNKSSVIESAADKKCLRLVLLSMTRNRHQPTRRVHPIEFDRGRGVSDGECLHNQVRDRIGL